jgi:hypothetical protein
MAELKTQVTNASVDKFIKGLKDERVQADCRTIVRMMQKATGAEPKMWGAGIVGFGSYHYKYSSGRQGDWFAAGFSPRKQNLTLYIMHGFDEYPALLKKLGKYTTGKSCLYIKKLADVDLKVLEQIVTKSVKALKAAKT